MLRILHVIVGLDKGKHFPVSDEFTILLGRSKHANMRMLDLSVSRVHCEVEIRNRKIHLTDLESASSTDVNNKRVTECELRVGDSLRIGETQMRVETPVGETDQATVATLPFPIAVPKRPVLKTAAQRQNLKGNKISHYDVGDVIAKGHSGLLFKARDFKNDRTVALKVGSSG